MRTRRGLILVVAAILLAGPGCVCCGNKGYGLARDVSPDCDIPASQRNQVYVFALTGLNPLDMLALEDLREQLNKQGFAKVATGQTIHSLWMAAEMRRIREAEPNAVFVLLGTPGGTATASRLAERAAADGIPVGAVVLIDAGGNAAVSANGLRTVTVESPDAAAIAGVLNEVAVATHFPITEEATAWDYPYATPPRPIGDPSRAPEWAYLFDQPGSATRPINQSAPVFASSDEPAAPARAER